jgi:hypothetical protein
LWASDAAWDASAAPASTPDTTFEVEMDGVRAGWTWDAASGTYLRSQNGNQHTAMSGARIAVNNVVEISTFHAPSPVDARSPNPVTVGGDFATVHRDGVSIPATWLRRTPYEPFTFLDALGQPIPLDTGTTFVELVRNG